MSEGAMESRSHQDAPHPSWSGGRAVALIKTGLVWSGPKLMDATSGGGAFSVFTQIKFHQVYLL